MSIEAMLWAKRTETGTPTRRLVLYVLADYADQAGSCWPSQRTIASQTELSERTVRRALGELEERQLIRRLPRSRPDGSRTTDRYQLALDPLDTEPAPPDTVTGPPGHSTPGPPDTVTGHEPSDEQLEEPTETPGAASPAPGATLFEVPTVVDELCAELAERVATQRGGARPPVTTRWRTDMRRLLERGPLHQDTPGPVEPERVRACLAVVFGELADPQGRSGFCWADQIRSPSALRDHWWQVYRAAQALHQQSRLGKMAPVSRAVHGGQVPDLGPVLAEAYDQRDASLRALYGSSRPALGAGG